MRSREKIVADTQRCMTFVEPARTPALLAGVIELLTDLRDQNEKVIRLLEDLAVNQPRCGEKAERGICTLPIHHRGDHWCH